MFWCLAKEAGSVQWTYRDVKMHCSFALQLHTGSESHCTHCRGLSIILPLMECSMLSRVPGEFIGMRTQMA